MPKISVIILTHNRAALLPRAISSVLNQTYQSFELLIVDDASKDNTREVVGSFCDNRTTYIRHEVNKGEAASRNTGILNSKGEYIAFLDDDDEWLPKKLEMQVNLLESCSERVGGIYAGSLRIDQGTGAVLSQWLPSKRGYLYNEISINNCIGTPSSVLLRKKCFDLVGMFDESIVYGPDYDMWVRISKEFHFEYIREPLIKYFVHDNRLSTNSEKMIRGLEAQLEKHGSFFATNSKGYARRYRSLGKLYCYNGDVSKGRRAFLKAMRIYPFDIKHYLDFCLSLLGAENYRRSKRGLVKLIGLG
jgi:glycosyltransferase involved in cell wall biosynthesis